MRKARIKVDSERPIGPPNPFEAYLLIACLIQGLAVLTRQAKPTSIEGALSPFLLLLWAALLTLGGVLALAGLFWPGDPFTGVEVKRVGLVAVGFGTLAYGVALTTLGAPGIVVALSNLGFAAACAVRCWQIGRRLRELRRRLTTIREKPGDA